MCKKDFVFVGIQFFLFVVYFMPLFSGDFQTNDWIRYFFLVSAVVGLLIVLIAFRQMERSLTPLPTPRVSGELVRTGLYKYVRHPIYTGLILASVGFGIYRESGWKILIGLLLWILFYFKSAYEEKLLTVRYPEYEDYRKHTSRFFPFF